jgi:uncharacterized protein involved in exopolysaccharide biosynthesis
MTSDPLPESNDTALSLLDFARVIWRHRRWTAGLCGGFAALALIVALVLPRIYTATATILTPQEGGKKSLLSALADTGMAQSFTDLSVPSLAPHRDLFVSILKSRSMAEDVVAKFGLVERYGADYAGDAVERLRRSTDISLSKEGVISVEVDDTDPRVAADIANFFVSNLNVLLSRFSTTEAGRQKAFLLGRVAETEKALLAAEADLVRYQERHQAVSLPDQTKEAVEAFAQLRGEILAAEVQLEVLRSGATDANPEVVRLRRGIDEMRRQLAEMQFGNQPQGPEPAPGGGPDFEGAGVRAKEVLVPFAEVPELALELVRLTRNLKIQETVYALLTRQLEEAKIAEARDTPVVQVLDTAAPPDRPSKPKVPLFVTVAGVLGFFIGVLVAFIRESRTLHGRPAVAAPAAAQHTESSSPRDPAVKVEAPREPVPQGEPRPEPKPAKKRREGIRA